MKKYSNHGALTPLVSAYYIYLKKRYARERYGTYYMYNDSADPNKANSKLPTPQQLKTTPWKTTPRNCNQHIT